MKTILLDTSWRLSDKNIMFVLMKKHWGVCHILKPWGTQLIWTTCKKQRKVQLMEGQRVHMYAWGLEIEQCTPGQVCHRKYCSSVSQLDCSQARLYSKSCQQPWLLPWANFRIKSMKGIHPSIEQYYLIHFYFEANSAGSTRKATLPAWNNGCQGQNMSLCKGPCSMVQKKKRLHNGW